MKAFLLAGGRGERLKPLTLSVPKCLAPIDGRPLLEAWIDLLAREGVKEVLVNVSHHADQVRSFLEEASSDISFHLVVEPAPLGTAGTVARQQNFVSGEESFWILYADNLSAVSLRQMATAHAAHDGILTMGLFRAADPRAAGIAELDEHGRIVGFEEKPETPRGDLANAGVYLARQAIFEHIPAASGIVDFAHNVFPRLVGRMYGYELTGFHRDIGTPDSLQRAAADWREIKSREQPA